MFPTDDGKWEPYKIRELKKSKPDGANGAPKEDGDVSMGGTEEKTEDGSAEPEYEEDLDNDEGSVWPIEGNIPANCIQGCL
jgi:hypothetical protein